MRKLRQRAVMLFNLVEDRFNLVRLASGAHPLNQAQETTSGGPNLACLFL